MMKPAALLLATVVLSGCALSPGQHPRGGMQPPGQSPAWDADFNLVPITASLVRELAAPTMRAEARNPQLTDEVSAWQYRVQPQDILTVVIWNHPELTIPAGQFRSAAEAGHKVAHDGTIFYPYVGVVNVAGRTTAEIREILTRGLTRYIQNPQVDVRIAGFESQRVHLVGEVRQPRFAPISDVPLTLVRAIAIAEGPTPEADLSRVAVLRDGERIERDIQALMDFGDLSQDMLLRDGDVVHVPDRAMNKVYVLGEVRRPRSLLMHRGRMTLAEAIGDSEGFDMVSSDPSRVFVIRGDVDRPSVYWLDARSPDALLLAERFPLEPRDVVFVSTAPVTRWGRVINQLAPTIRSLRDIENASR